MADVEDFGRLTANDGQYAPFAETTVTVNAPPSGSPLYFSPYSVATLGGVTVENEDVVYYDGSSFSLAFDGSDVGLAGLNIDAFSWVSGTTAILSFEAPGAVPGIAGTVDDSDLVLFEATSLGADTAGSFSLYFDGSDVELTANSEDVNGVARDSSGNLYLSTRNQFSVTVVSGADEDVFVFTPSSLGPDTSGTYAPTRYFDGSNFGLAANELYAIDLP